MSEREECRHANFIVVSIPNIYILTVQRSTTFGSVIEIRRVLFDAARNGERKFTALDYMTY